MTVTCCFQLKMREILATGIEIPLTDKSDLEPVTGGSLGQSKGEKLGTSASVLDACSCIYCHIIYYLIFT